MENTQIISPKEKQSRKEYMREYKRKQYIANADKIKENNKMYYHKNKNNVSLEKMKEYKGNCFVSVSKIMNNMEILKNDDPPMFKKLINEYYNDIIKPETVKEGVILNEESG